MPHLRRPASGLSTRTVAEFDAGEWIVATGSGSVTTVHSPSTSGDALEIAYNVGAGGLAIATTATAPGIPGAPRSVEVDVHGDGSWNVFYVELRDATGEVFRYWAGTQDAGSLGFEGWRTLTFPVGRSSDTLVAHTGGDEDGVMDLPTSLYHLVVYPGPNPQATSSTIVVDHLVVVTDADPTPR